MNLDQDGFHIFPSAVPPANLDQLATTLFQEENAGRRCLLDHPLVTQTALDLKQVLIESGHLPSSAVAIQAIAFNKTAATNWKVAWHQDLMFPFARPVSAENFDLPAVKDNIAYARPPAGVLEQLLAVRLHLDDCDETNGPLRVSPGTHRSGILPTAEIPNKVSDHGEVPCLAEKGQILLMRPLILHASSKAIEPKHRRILHLVYHSGAPLAESWHRAI